MGLFVKRHSAGEHAPLYTIGSNRTVLVIGLGNLGKKYESTRHNIGFACVDAYAANHDFDKWIDKKDLSCLITTNNVGGTRVILAKPTTYMNLSGEAVQAVSHFFKVANSDLLIVHDELDVTFGSIKTKRGGSSAGHNGVQSIIGQIGDDFGRVRVGIGKPKNPKQDPADYVLQKFEPEESEQMKPLQKEVISVIDDFVASGNLLIETRQFIF